jgi:XRE family transcriptional regulator, regulator of sulfur utilization
VAKTTSAEKQLRRALAANVRASRDARGWTLEETSQHTGVHWRHIQKIEAGEVSATLRTLGALATGFGVGSWELLKPTS